MSTATLPRPDVNDPTYEPDDELQPEPAELEIQASALDTEDKHAQDGHQSVEDVLRDIQASEQKRQKAIVQELGLRKATSDTYLAAVDGINKRLARLGYQEPTAAFVKSTPEQILGALNRGIAEAFDAAPKRRGRRPGSKNKTAEATTIAAPAAAKKRGRPAKVTPTSQPTAASHGHRGRPKGSKMSEETKAKIRAAHALRKKEAEKAAKGAK